MSREEIRNHLNKLRDDFKKYDKDMEIGSISDGGRSYLVYLVPKNLKKGDYVTDNEYLYDKNTQKITPFRVTDDPKFHDIATRHIIYMKPDLRDE